MVTDELCRKCGADMTDKLFCPHCNEVIQKTCTKCDYKTDEHMHLHDLHQKATLGLLAVGFEALDLFPLISLA